MKNTHMEHPVNLFDFPGIIEKKLIYELSIFFTESEQFLNLSMPLSYKETKELFARMEAYQELAQIARLLIIGKPNVEEKFSASLSKLFYLGTQNKEHIHHEQEKPFVDTNIRESMNEEHNHVNKEKIRLYNLTSVIDIFSAISYLSFDSKVNYTEILHTIHPARRTSSQTTHQHPNKRTAALVSIFNRPPTI